MKPERNIFLFINLQWYHLEELYGDTLIVTDEDGGEHTFLHSDIEFVQVGQNRFDTLPKHPENETSIVV